jgi:hypothetical protein
MDQPCKHGVETRTHRLLLHSVQHPNVFLSYRWGAESDVVERVFNILTGPPFCLRVFWDKKCIDCSTRMSATKISCCL